MNAQALFAIARNGDDHVENALCISPETVKGEAHNHLHDVEAHGMIGHYEIQ